MKKTIEKKQSFYVDYKFTDLELLEKGKDLAKRTQERAALDLKKKEITSQMNAEVSAKDAEINLIGTKLNNGYENRKVEGKVIFDFDKGVKDFYYEGEHVKTEKLTQDDYQLEADLK